MVSGCFLCFVMVSLFVHLFACMFVCLFSCLIQWRLCTDFHGFRLGPLQVTWFNREGSLLTKRVPDMSRQMMPNERRSPWFWPACGFPERPTGSAGKNGCEFVLMVPFEDHFKENHGVFCLPRGNHCSSSAPSPRIKCILCNSAAYLMPTITVRHNNLIISWCYVGLLKSCTERRGQVFRIWGVAPAFTNGIEFRERNHMKQTHPLSR